MQPWPNQKNRKNNKHFEENVGAVQRLVSHGNFFNKYTIHK